jgi:hypothetical protein
MYKKKLTHQKKDHKKTPKTALIIALILFAISVAALIMVPTYYDSSDTYKYAKNKIEELNLSQCQIESNVWPQLNYLGIMSAPFPRQILVNDTINKGSILVMFKYAGEPEYVKDADYINTLPIIYEDNLLYVIGNENCTQKKPYTRSYLKEVKEYVLKKHNYEPNINPCFIMFKKYSILEKTCNYIHGSGFKIDENRELW